MFDFLSLSLCFTFVVLMTQHLLPFMFLFCLFTIPFYLLFCFYFFLLKSTTKSESIRIRPSTAPPYSPFKHQLIILISDCQHRARNPRMTCPPIDPPHYPRSCFAKPIKIFPGSQFKTLLSILFLFVNHHGAKLGSPGENSGLPLSWGPLFTFPQSTLTYFTHPLPCPSDTTISYHKPAQPNVSSAVPTSSCERITG